MNLYEQDVSTFMARMGQPFGSLGVFDDETIDFRDTLIKEETDETIHAITNHDMIETIDGFCDCLYVGIGAALAFGLKLSDYYPTCPEPDAGMIEPGFVDPEEAISILRGARTVVYLALDTRDPSAATVALTGYVAIIFGLAARFNIPVRSFWDEVHRSNLAKTGGAIRADGKRLKPPGWTPPDLRRVYLELFGKLPR